MKYLTIVLLLAACSRSNVAPAPAVTHTNYGRDHYDAAVIWAKNTGAAIFAVHNAEEVQFWFDTPEQMMTMDQIADVRKNKILPLMKECYKETGIDHMTVIVFPPDPQLKVALTFDKEELFY